MLANLLPWRRIPQIQKYPASMTPDRSAASLSCLSIPVIPHFLELVVDTVTPSPANVECVIIIMAF